jgi:hypothetical protein
MNAIGSLTSDGTNIAILVNGNQNGNILTTSDLNGISNTANLIEIPQLSEGKVLLDPFIYITKSDALNDFF